MPVFKLKIKDLTNLSLTFPEHESSMFKISGNYEEIIDRIMQNDQDKEFKSMIVRDGQIINGVIRFNAILSLIKNKLEYQGVKYSDFSQEQYNTFNSFVFDVEMDNVNTNEAAELFKKVNNISN
ncbi:hypothetical protein [Paenibacillus polymyxa]|uniref:hypothetical protein n=1 Tax=Paenibacillus polymyxa TaxID=1406 RepID=UPI00041E5241|nr:hypothetical protein [Paenibacillus polymyxa]